MPCPSCSSPVPDPSGGCPSCGWSDRPQGPQPEGRQNVLPAQAARPPAPRFQQQPGYPQPGHQQYPPQSPGCYPLAYTVPTAPSGLAQAVQVLLGLAGLVALLGLAANTYSFATAWSSMVNGTVGEDPQASAGLAVSVVVLVIGMVLTLGTAVCFMVWLYRCGTLSAILAPGEQRLGRGWAIGGWFVPIAYLVLPRLFIGDVWRAARPVEEIARRRGRTALVSWWWVPFCFQQTCFVASMESVQEAINSDSTRAYIIGTFLGVQLVTLARVVAAVLGVLMVRRLTARQQIRILQGPGPGHPYSLAVSGPGYAGVPQYQAQQFQTPTPAPAPPVQDAPVGDAPVAGPPFADAIVQEPQPPTAAPDPSVVLTKGAPAGDALQSAPATAAVPAQDTSVRDTSVRETSG